MPEAICTLCFWEGDLHKNSGARPFWGGLCHIQEDQPQPPFQGSLFISAPAVSCGGDCLLLLLIFRKVASSRTKMCITEQQLFAAFEVEHHTQESTFTWSFSLPISTCKQRLMNNNDCFRIASLPLLIWSCLFPETPLIEPDTINQFAWIWWQPAPCFFTVNNKGLQGYRMRWHPPPPCPHLQRMPKTPARL